MRARRLIRPGLSLLLAAGLSLSGISSPARASAQKKTAAGKTGSSTRKKSGRKSRRRERGQQAPTRERISEIQQALAKDGSYPGEPSGKWDDSTVAAMKKFQESHGLNPTGKMDAKTLQQLGLGSPTAGQAPPLPPLSSSALPKTPAEAARQQP